MSQFPPPGPISFETMRQIQEASPFNKSLGIKLIALEDGYCELELPIRPDLLQFHGYVHGAVVGCVADNACAWAAASVAGSVVTGEYKLNLLAPAVGEMLRGKGYVIKSSRRQVVSRSEVFAVNNGEEKIVAAAQATIIPLSEQE